MISLLVFRISDKTSFITSDKTSLYKEKIVLTLNDICNKLPYMNTTVNETKSMTAEEKKRLKNRRKKANRKIKKKTVVTSTNTIESLDDSFSEESQNYDNSFLMNRSMTETESDFVKSFNCSNFDTSNLGKYRAVLELFEYNIFEEYDALKRLVKCAEELGKKDMYKIARMKIFEYILNCVKGDPINGDVYSAENEQLLKDARKILYDTDGMDGMHDRLLWSFVPKRYHREINMSWDGIGKLRS